MVVMEEKQKTHMKIFRSKVITPAIYSQWFREREGGGRKREREMDKSNLVKC